MTYLTFRDIEDGRPRCRLIGPLLAPGTITGRDPGTGIMPNRLDEQCANVFVQVRALVEASGGSVEDILQLSFRLADYRDRQGLERVWVAMFPDPATRPARRIAAAPLEGGALVHCELLAVLGSDPRGSRRNESATD